MRSASLDRSLVDAASLRNLVKTGTVDAAAGPYSESPLIAASWLSGGSVPRPSISF